MERSCQAGTSAPRFFSVASPNPGSGPSGGPADIPPRNERFSGRQSVLQAVEDTLTKHKRAALVGMPGVGKTDTAKEFIYTRRVNYAHIFWIVADTEENLRSGYDALARQLGLIPSTEQEQNVGIDAAIQWFANHNDYLLVLDNADDVDGYDAKLIPPRHGHLLLTARPDRLKRIATLVSVEKMNSTEGATCLLTCAGITDPTAEQQVSAENVSKVLDGLPLALHQAGAYIAAHDDDIEGYNNLLASHKGRILRWKDKGLGKDARTVHSTFNLAMEALGQKHPAAFELLRFCAFLAPDDIQESLFTTEPDALPEPLDTIAADEFEWNEILSAATSLALIDRDITDKSFSVHRLIQDVIRVDLDKTTQEQYVEQIADLLGRVFPGGEYGTWEECERLLPHQRACFADIERLLVHTEKTANICGQSGFYLLERSAWSAAEPFLLRTLAIREEILGPNHPNTAQSLNNLAGLYDNKGEYTKAEPLYVRAISIYEKTIGSSQPETVQSFNNLAALYDNQGKHAEAEPLYLRALAIREKILAPNHPDIAQSLNNLAALYNNLEKYAEAESLHLRALAIREKVLDPNHPDIAQSLNNLAVSYDNQGKYAKAESLYVRALEICEENLGPNHPRTADGLNNFAILRYYQNRVAEAVSLLHRAALIRENVLGLAHPHTATSLESWAAALAKLGRTQEAAEKFAKAQTARTAYARLNVAP